MDNKKRRVSKGYQNDCNLKPRRRPYLPFMRTRRALRSALRDSGSVAMFERLAASASIT